MIPFWRRSISLPIDPLFLGSVETSSLCAAQVYPPDLGVQIIGGSLCIRRRWTLCSSSGIVTIAGVRKGFSDWHFKPFTAAQQARNATFYSSAYG